MKEFWLKSNVKEYMIKDLYDVDEIVRRFGACPNDEDYKIVRSYYFWEWEGNENWNVIQTTKDDYDKNIENEDIQYRTELNYNEFADVFWFSEFEDTICGKVEIFSRYDFIDAVNETFYTLHFEGQAKYFLKEVIEGLESLSRQIARFSNFKKEIQGFEANKIQQFVLKTFYDSYKDCISDIINEYEFICPEITNYINNYSPTIKKNPKIEYKTIWQKLGILIAIGSIEFEQKKNFGFEIKYKNILFESGNALARELSEEWEIKQESLKSYINDTLNANMNLNRKNIFNSLKKAEFLITHCRENNIEPSKFLIKKLEELKNKGI
ncbi:hypothetical protein [Flavobacterium tegetincola]|uniref:hypothetical protein n=1 Tax=Flavobacterium tegetincola TaxID=150172 RepID=UPI00040BD1E1|nr:hypothetical protein [Flavobacterium tegetincola]